MLLGGLAGSAHRFVREGGLGARALVVGRPNVDGLDGVRERTRISEWRAPVVCTHAQALEHRHAHLYTCHTRLLAKPPRHTQ